MSSRRRTELIICQSKATNTAQIDSHVKAWLSPPNIGNHELKLMSESKKSADLFFGRQTMKVAESFETCFPKV